MAQSRVSSLLAANAEFAKTWSNPMTMSDMRKRQMERVFVLTCMDPRVVPEQFLGPEPRVATCRNAGGRFSADVLRTITVARALPIAVDTLPFTVMVVHHTDCGMLHLTNEDVMRSVKARSDNAEKLIEGIDFGFIGAGDLEASILSDVNALKREELLKGADVRGFVLETETGLLRELQTK